MGRNFAGILGLLAFLTTLVRGLLAGASAESILVHGTLALLVFACGGGLLGALAAVAMDEAAAKQVEAEWAEGEATPAR